MTLILASASPRRRELLGMFGLEFSVEPAGIDEGRVGSESPAEYVARIALAKAQTIARRRPGAAVLGSDTEVVLDGECLGKPVNQGEAAAMLRRLSGRRHQVLSAVALVGPDGENACRLCETRVTFATLPEAWIERYVASGEPNDKAGAYGIQGAAAIWISRLEGSYTGVVGLPLFETGELLRRAGLVLFFPDPNR